MLDGWGAHLSTSDRLVRLCLVFAVAGLAGGCFQPVYGDRSVSGGPGVREALKGVQIPIITAPANSPTAPVAVQLRNDLIFNFTGGGTPTSPTDRLGIQLVGAQILLQSTILASARSRTSVFTRPLS